MRLGGRARLALGLVAALTVVGCFQQPVEAPSDGDDQPHPAVAVVTDYLTALGQDRGRVMVGISTGPAQGYARYRVAVTRGDPRGFSELGVEITRPFSVASEDSGEAVLDGEAALRFEGREGPTVVELRDFVAMEQEGRWLVRSYRRDGRPLEDFVVIETVEGRNAAARVTIRLAYRDPSVGSLTLPLEITNSGQTPLVGTGFTASFTATETGRTHTSTAAGPDEIAPGATEDAVVTFVEVDDAGAGGTLTITLEEVAGETVPVSLEVPAFSGP